MNLSALLCSLETTKRCEIKSERIGSSGLAGSHTLLGSDLFSVKVPVQGKGAEEIVSRRVYQQELRLLHLKGGMHPRIHSHSGKHSPPSDVSTLQHDFNLPYAAGLLIKSKTSPYVSANASFAFGRRLLRDATSFCTLELNSITHSFTRFKHCPVFDFTR
ncbi:hypothetical protein Prudu_008082 [Prunus dulcis]|uniref:Uncharacterized protein n=1 Tax=Prunus dulcis TaxID=3755 RepID=A0A4Y1R3J0_PRUDU|nr:hypothetical protein Prudu_008082 [Prunus dulcis]